jgi:ubiquinone/menaquinone biosynthesis C-methylase UbiE
LFLDGERAKVGFYARSIFPFFLDWLLGTPEFGRYRRESLAAARGKTLEIGLGTGLNLPYYPASVEKLWGLDVERMLPDRVAQRVASAPMPVEIIHLDAQGRLPFADRTFDTVVTTLTLCSIPDPSLALAEMRRVLKDEGDYLFFEHGRSDDEAIARRQDRVNPLQRIVGAGCNLNRPIDQLIRDAGFKIIRLDRFLMPKTPRSLAEMYRGAARRVTG